MAARIGCVRMPDRTAHAYALLQWATAVYAFGLVVHTVDHLRRGIGVLTHEVLWAGNLSTLAGMALIALVYARNRAAPAAAVVLGFPTALGVAAVHLLPRWSPFSDAFVGAHAHHTGVTPISWVVVLVEIIGALGMGIAGLLVLTASQPADRIGRRPNAT